MLPSRPINATGFDALSLCPAKPTPGIVPPGIVLRAQCHLVSSYITGGVKFFSFFVSGRGEQGGLAAAPSFSRLVRSVFFSGRKNETAKVDQGIAQAVIDCWVWGIGEDRCGERVNALKHSRKT